MLSNQLQNGMDRAKNMWSLLPNTDENEDDLLSILKKNDGGGVESLDYEVIENYAYWDEQVLLFCFVSAGLWKILNTLKFLVFG